MFLSNQGSVLGLLISLSIAAHGALMSEAEIAGQVQQSFDGAEVSSCGIVISAIETITGPPTGKLLIFSGSFRIVGAGGGIVKGGASEIDAKVVASGKLDLRKIQPLETTNVWLKAPNAPVTTPIKSAPLQKSDDPGYLIYVSDFNSVFGLVQAVQAKQPIQIGVRVKGGKYDQALFGVVQMSDAQGKQFDQCLLEWSSAVLKKNERAAPANPSTSK